MGMNTLEKTIAKLEARFEEANWNRITITMKCNGDIVEITPCGHGQISRENVEYFLVEGRMPWMGADTIEKLAHDLKKKKKIVKEHEEEQEKVREFYRNHIAGGRGTADQWEFFSDWHKDVFGYRPHGGICG